MEKFINRSKNQPRDPVKELINAASNNGQEVKRLTINEFHNLKRPLKFAPGIFKDHKRLERLLLDICKTVNMLVTGCQ